ncbi:MAG: adenosylcobalamin-dependent ribonucleoside-diphosphate reductase [Candidatus Paceibacterota bacterium]|jgi:ribonucleoside-diphosphate reductase alpha chain
MIATIVKRNGTHVPFVAEKITNAIFKASVAAGVPDWKKAQTLAAAVVASVAKVSRGSMSVEEVQDIVERVLIEHGLAKIAKAYILYRQHRAEVREEKGQILQKEEIDEVDKRFDTNALRVLVARYLRKNDEGKIIESPRELFTRVAIHTVLPSLFYDKRVFSKKEKKIVGYVPTTIDSKKYQGQLHIGSYELNQFHLEALPLIYDRLAGRGMMKVPLERVIAMLKKGEFDAYEKEVRSYYDLMVARKFMPNTPAIANFGNVLGMGSACFVLGVEDDISDIMDKLKAAAIIFKAGGGVGYNFSKLRPEGDFVKSTGGVASGPISFMSMFDNMTDVIKQGGIRRGANMGILNSNHPDVMKFIKAKEGNKAMRNFNISILLMDDFWKYYEKKEPYPLLNPRTGKVSGYIDARQLFDLLAYQAWESAEPGVIFADHANEFNPFLKYLGPIVTTNPCGEVLLYPYESCNLGSINVWAFVDKTSGKKPQMAWDELAAAVQTASRFLDNVTDVNRYPLKEIEDMTLFTRKIGLGIMGLGDLLYELDLPYNSKAGLDFMGELMEFVNYHSKVASVDLAKSRGALPAYRQSFYKEGKLPFAGFADKKSWHFDWNAIARDVKKYGVRNGYTTVIAPTGSISMIAGCSSGIEPVYSLVFEKHITVGSFYYVDPVFEERMQKEGLIGDDLIKDVAAHKGSVAQLSYIPEKAKRAFVTAHDITPSDHIRALAAIQKWVDSSISKTNNFPADATVDDVKEAYLLAYKLKCKDVTVFRDGSIVSQVLVAGKESKKKEKEKPKKDGDLVQLKDEKAKGLAVYKEASVHADVISLGMSPAHDEKESDDGVDFNGAVACKVCNL